jgi:hypothetical protein
MRRRHRGMDRAQEALTAILPGTTALAKTYGGFFNLVYILVASVLIRWTRRGVEGARSSPGGK